MPTTLQEALAVFARTRNSAIVPALLELGEQALAGFTPPQARKNIDFHRTWLAMAGDPLARSWHLKMLMAQLPKLYEGEEKPYGEKSDAVIDRLKAYEAVPPDGRIARAVLDLLELDPPEFPHFDAVLGRVLALHGDETTEATLRKIAPKYWDNPTYAEVGIPQRVFPKCVALSAAEAAVYGSIRRVARPDAEQLLRMVYGAPHDDAPREVFSDVLLEEGDPRGEFIALQLREHRGLASETDIARAQALTRAHGKNWLGPLRPLVSRAELRRGFLWRIDLAGSWSAKAAAWEELAHHPSLSTLEELRPGQARSKLVVPFLRSGALRALRFVSVGDPLLLEAVKGAKLPSLEGLDQVDTPAAVALAAEDPRITRVGVTRLNAATQLKKWPEELRARLVTVTCWDELGKAMKLFDLLPDLQELNCSYRGEMSISRSSPHRLRVEPHPVSLDLKGLPRGVKVVEITASAAFCKKTAKAYPRLEIVARRPASGVVSNPKG